MEDWKRLLSDLYDHLERRERRFDLFSEIDHAILQRSYVALHLVENVLTKLLVSIDSRSGYLFLRHEHEYRFARAFGRSTAVEGVPPISEATLSGSSNLLKSSDCLVVMPWLPADTQSLTAFDIKVETQSWGLLLLESQKPIQGDGTYVENVLHQISIALQDLKVRSRLERYESIHRLFFEKDLDQNECLQILRDRARQILSSHEKLLIQILFYAKPDTRDEESPRSGGETLTIRWSSNPVEVGALVPIESFSGRALQSGRPYLMADPSSPEFAAIYKAFSEFPSRSELALIFRKDSSSEPLGVLNIESPDSNAFNSQELEELLDLVALVSPILGAVRRRILMSSLNRQASLYAVNAYLDNLISVYAHKFDSRTSGLDARLTTTRQLAAPDIKADLEGIRADFAWMKGALEELWQEMAHVAWEGEIKLVELLTDIEEEEKTTAQRYLRIHSQDFVGLPSVKASRLLKEHMRNLILNSVVSLDHKYRTPDFKGLIEVRAERATIRQNINGDAPDPIADLNQRVRLIIRDNGSGISKANLEEVFRPGFSTFGTQGFGLPAARDYVRALGGDLRLESVEGEFCKVSLEIPVFTSDWQKGREMRRRTANKLAERDTPRNEANIRSLSS